ncbi:alpha/beta fold hydrolase [Caldibacillus debilis]|uniref:Alpha/beta hydrolase n=1 Tax=Caldibacillus debilis TaxID=301148 RepID=A0A150LE46_9BACI|nr:hypothetical protein [Caldibacillus debilis]KYD10623.1 hypothetical protein B4135_3424 [Caldibacillus debilis]MBO2481044.1 hypothetical protein [Bacillaceae bacterium]
MDYRIFTLNKKTCIIHYPAKPNGFGVLWIGYFDGDIGADDRPTVNKPRKSLMDELNVRGYTVFYTVLEKHHFANPQALEQVENLYEFVKRNEILNEKIHLIAEGIGALLAESFLADKGDYVRSAVFIDPAFSLKKLTEEVKDQPFLLKKLYSDLKKAYSLSSDEECEIFINNQHRHPVVIPVPFQIVHFVRPDRKREGTDREEKYQNLAEDRILALPSGGRHALSAVIFRLFKETEKQL